MPFRTRTVRALEAGRWDGPVARAFASMLAPIAGRAVVRPASVPADVGVVCVGGATLGGSGKTRLAIACARGLATRGARVSFVGHGYRATLPRPRVVTPEDRLADVGDEALVAARALAALGVEVVVGPTRQAAIEHALSLERRPSILVIDGALRLRGAPRAMLSLLAVNAWRPWGSGRLPPAGDLRAPRARLLAEADLVVPVDPTPSEVRWREGRREPVASLVGKRLGLFTAMARPDRLVRALAEVGVRPAVVISAPDHGPASAAPLANVQIDAWVGTAKCVVHLEALGLVREVGTLLGSFELGGSLDEPLAHALDALAYRSECVSHLHGAP